MSQCGASIDVGDIASAVIEMYGGDIASHTSKRLNLDEFVRSKDGIARDLTLKGSLTLQDTVIESLCKYMAPCIKDTVDAEVDKLKTELSADIDKIKTDAGKKIAELEDKITKLDDKVDEISIPPEVVGFEIDHGNGKLVIKFKDGEPLTIARDELVEWLRDKPKNQSHKTMAHEAYGISTEVGYHEIRIGELSAIGHEAYGVSVSIGEHKIN